MQIHLQCVADTTGLQIVVGINVQPVIILGGTDIGAKHLICVEAHLHVKLQQIVVLNDLVSEGNVLGAEPPAAGEVFRFRLLMERSLLQPVQEDPPPFVRRSVALLHSEVGGGAHIPDSEPLPAIHDVDGLHISAVEVDVVGTHHPAGVVQPLRHIGVELLLRDPLGAQQRFDKAVGRFVGRLADVAAQTAGGREQLKIFLGQNIIGAAVLRDMEDSEAPCGLPSLLLRLLLRPELVADALVFLLRKLVAHFIKDILQMLLQCFPLQVFTQRVVPSLIEPECDLTAPHFIPPISGPHCFISGYSVRRCHTPFA